MKNIISKIIVVVLPYLLRIDFVFKFFSWSLWQGYLKGEGKCVDLLVMIMHARYKLVDSKLNIMSEEQAVEYYKTISAAGTKTNYDNNTVADGSTKIVDGLIIPPASSTPMQDGEIHINVVPSLMAAQSVQVCKTYHQDVSKGWRFIRFMMMHEVWHTNQFRFVLDNGGLSLLKRVTAMEVNSQYSEGPLEVGANRYAASKGKDKQDLSILLAA